MSLISPTLKLSVDLRGANINFCTDCFWGCCRQAGDEGSERGSIASEAQTVDETALEVLKIYYDNAEVEHSFVEVARMFAPQILGRDDIDPQNISLDDLEESIEALAPYFEELSRVSDDIDCAQEEYDIMQHSTETTTDASQEGHEALSGEEGKKESFLNRALAERCNPETIRDLHEKLQSSGVKELVTAGVKSLTALLPEEFSALKFVASKAVGAASGVMARTAASPMTKVHDLIRLAKEKKFVRLNVTRDEEGNAKNAGFVAVRMGGDSKYRRLSETRRRTQNADISTAYTFNKIRVSENDDEQRLFNWAADIYSGNRELSVREAEKKRWRGEDIVTRLTAQRRLFPYWRAFYEFYNKYLQESSETLDFHKDPSIAMSHHRSLERIRGKSIPELSDTEIELVLQVLEERRVLFEERLFLAAGKTGDAISMPQKRDVIDLACSYQKKRYRISQRGFKVLTEQDLNDVEKCIETTILPVYKEISRLYGRIVFSEKLCSHSQIIPGKKTIFDILGHDRIDMTALRKDTPEFDDEEIERFREAFEDVAKLSDIRSSRSLVSLEHDDLVKLIEYIAKTSQAYDEEFRALTKPYGEDLIRLACLYQDVDEQRLKKHTIVIESGKGGHVEFSFISEEIYRRIKMGIEELKGYYQGIVWEYFEGKGESNDAIKRRIESDDIALPITTLTKDTVIAWLNSVMEETERYEDDIKHECKQERIIERLAFISAGYASDEMVSSLYIRDKILGKVSEAQMVYSAMQSLHEILHNKYSQHPAHSLSTAADQDAADVDEDISLEERRYKDEFTGVEARKFQRSATLDAYLNQANDETMFALKEVVEDISREYITHLKGSYSGDLLDVTCAYCNIGYRTSQRDYVLTKQDFEEIEKCQKRIEMRLPQMTEIYGFLKHRLEEEVLLHLQTMRKIDDVYEKIKKEFRRKDLQREGDVHEYNEGRRAATSLTDVYKQFLFNDDPEDLEMIRESREMSDLTPELVDLIWKRSTLLGKRKTDRGSLGTRSSVASMTLQPRHDSPGSPMMPRRGK